MASILEAADSVRGKVGGATAARTSVRKRRKKEVEIEGVGRVVVERERSEGDSFVGIVISLFMLFISQ